MYKKQCLKYNLALIQVVFHVGDRFWARENRRPKNSKTILFQDKFYSLKAHAHYFTTLLHFMHITSLFLHT